jgi:chondroitin-sulfate-ABC endolyase/exolyase
MLALLCGVPPAWGQLNLETSVPTNWTAAAGSLAISGNHYKLGLQSLQWNWETNDVLTVTNPGIAAADVTDFYKHTCDLWVHNPTNLPGRKLQFQFLNAAGTAQYYFDFYLDYSGWRHAVRSFKYDMKGPKSSASFNRVRILAPTNGPGGQFFLDAVTWVGPRFTRVQDLPNADIAGYLSDSNYYRAHYQLPPDIAATNPTSAELAELAMLRSRWLGTNAGATPSGSALNTAYLAWTNLNIVANGSEIRGQVLTQDTSAYESWVLTLGQDVYWRTNAESLNKLSLVIRHWFDQGWDYGSGDAQAGGSTGYDFRNTPRGFILGYKAYDPAFRQHLWQMLHWMYKMGDFWEPNWAPGGDTDDIYLNIRQQLGAILFLTPDDATAVQYLKGLRRYVERFLIPANGTDGGLKVDGTGFHHQSHYNAYMYAFRELSDVLHLERGTSFQVNSNAYLNLRAAFFAMLRMANKDAAAGSPGYTANSLCGRHPFTATLPFDYKTIQRLGEWGGGVLGGQAADSVVAQAYNRLFGTSYPFALFTPYGAEPNPTGFYQFNYSPIGLYRQSNWVATLHGMNSPFWGSEIYATENRYGRYQSYGALEILYPGGIGASGFSLVGWDWNHPPGTTTILLPWTNLVAEVDTEHVSSALNFSGGLSFQGQAGLYACNFQELAVGANHNPSFAWRKSWFCFSNQVVCLGSNITNNDAAHPTITTLFQGLLTNVSAGTVLNGTDITAFPYSGTNNGASASWLLDNYGTGYFVRPGSTAILARSSQTSPDETGSGATSTTNYATAWLNHGPAPADVSYEYVVVPATTAAAMTQLATNYANAPTTPYEVLQQDKTAHVVRWKADNRIGYALFATNALGAAVTNVGPLRGASRPCLVMTRLDTNTLLSLTLVDPNLNLVNNVSTPTNLDLKLAGHWWLAAGPTSAAIIAVTPTNTVLRSQPADGLPVEVQLHTNLPPVLSMIGPQTIPRDGSAGPLPFTVTDDATPAEAITVSATSSNPALIPATNIVLAGAGSSRSVAATPAPGLTGSTVITLSASDGADSASTSFTVTVFDPSAVVLAIVSSPDGLALTWPADIGSWMVYGATHLEPPVIWSPVGASLLLTNQQWQVSLPPATNPASFYRLQLQ